MADRFAAGLTGDDVVAALNALAVEIQEKQDNIDALATELGTLRTEKATLEGTVATLRAEKDTLAVDLNAEGKEEAKEGTDCIVHRQHSRTCRISC